MTTYLNVGLDDHHDGYTNGREAARSALAQGANGGAVLALLFTSHPEPARVLKGVNDTLGNVPLIGTTTAGQYTHQGYVEQGTAIMLVQSEHIQFHLMAHQKRWFGGGKLLGNLRGTSQEGLGSSYKHRVLMLFPDNRSMNLDNLVERAMTETALLYDILGGASPAASAPARPPAMFFNGRMFRAGLSATEVLSERPLGLALANGWTPVSGPYRVTKTGDHRLITIDGRPAWEVYEDFLREQGVDVSRDTLTNVLLTYPVGVCREGECKVSVLMGVDEHGALLTTSPPPSNSLIHLLATQPDAMVTAARRAIETALTTLNSAEQAGALFIDCVSTGMVLKDAYRQQRAAVETCLGDIPFLGIRSHGVLARLQGQTNGHYECSVATCVLPA